MSINRLWLNEGKPYYFTKGHLVSKTKLQSGSAHLIVIFILVLTIIGLLGFVFWQNFMQPKATMISNSDSSNSSSTTADTSSEETDTDNNTVILNKSFTENVTGENLTLDYPDGWTIESKTGLNPSQATSHTNTYITSPDANVKITFWAGADGLGGTCGNNPSNITSVKTYSLPNYSGYTLYEITAPIHDDGDTQTISYGNLAMVLQDNSAIKVDASECVTGLGLFEAANGTSNSLYITFVGDLAMDHPSIDQINSARATDNYKTAVKIVQSLHRK